jgi:hypothetical protein
LREENLDTPRVYFFSVKKRGLIGYIDTYIRVVSINGNQIIALNSIFYYVVTLNRIEPSDILSERDKFSGSEDEMGSDIVLSSKKRNIDQVSSKSIVTEEPQKKKSKFFQFVSKIFAFVKK